VPLQHSSALGSRVVSFSRALVRPDLAAACISRSLGAIKAANASEPRHAQAQPIKAVDQQDFKKADHARPDN
jgi:hypothetical protein